MSKVLVVDDEAIITMQLEERLHAMGYTVVGMAASGEDAIEKARRLSPDLVLMDIVMPGKLNGVEAAQVIVGELDIPVIFITSYADDTIIEKAKQVRPYGYILKPFNELELKAAVEIALFRKASEEEIKKKAAALQSTLPAGYLRKQPVLRMQNIWHSLRSKRFSSKTSFPELSSFYMWIHR